MKLFKHAIAAAFILISAFSCVKGSYQTSYRAICTFEPADTVHDFSNGIYNKSDIYPHDLSQSHKFLIDL